MTEEWLERFPMLHRLGGVDCPGRLAHSSAEVRSARKSGAAADQVFYPAPFDPEAGAVLGDCRFVASSPEDLLSLERLAGASATPAIAKVGLRLQAEGYGPRGKAIALDELAEIAHAVKAMPHLTVRGCFFCGDLTGLHGKALGRFFRAGYESAKRMTVTLPCAMPYICYEGAVQAAAENRRLHPETLDELFNALDILTMQNQTAFYASLWLT